MSLGQRGLLRQVFGKNWLGRAMLTLATSRSHTIHLERGTRPLTPRHLRVIENYCANKRQAVASESRRAGAAAVKAIELEASASIQASLLVRSLAAEKTRQGR